MKHTKLFDCVIVGGGVAGMIAGIYLERFKCKTLIIDNNNSRANTIPRSHNFPAFPHGISGKKILARLRRQYHEYGNSIRQDTVLKIVKNKSKNNFVIKTKSTQVTAKNVILATGISDYAPGFPDLTNAIKRGIFRHCLICDGYEVNNKKIAIIGNDIKCLNEALLLRVYSNDITIFFINKDVKNKSFIKRLATPHIHVVSDAIKKVTINNKRGIITTDKKRYVFEAVYSALGAIVHTDLAIELGAKHLKEKSLITNKHRETSVPGLYAIGDIVTGLKQMSVAAGHAAIAATAIFNKLNVPNK